MRVLCVNAGSSSLKVALFEGENAVLRRSVAAVTLGEALDASLPAPDAVGHRLVHGGPLHRSPARVTAALRSSLDGLRRFAPLHLPRELALIDEISDRYPGVPQVVCFDTGFTRSLPEVAERLPIPRELHDAGLKRYGFHGLSYEHVVQTTPRAQRGRVVIAHLGGGSSMVAVSDGEAVDTTMGFTPTGGLIMGTRTGDMDPGALLYLMTERHLDAEGARALVDERSGLLGISGTTGDMASLLAARTGDPRAEVAVEMYCYTAAKFVGALSAALGGLDTLVFTGGIGEHSSEIRALVCSRLAHLGVGIDPGRNARGELCASRPRGRVAVLVVPADEERTIARHVNHVLASGAA